MTGVRQMSFKRLTVCHVFMNWKLVCYVLEVFILLNFLKALFLTLIPFIVA